MLDTAGSDGPTGAKNGSAQQPPRRRFKFIRRRLVDLVVVAAAFGVLHLAIRLLTRKSTDKAGQSAAITASVARPPQSSPSKSIFQAAPRRPIEENHLQVSERDLLKDVARRDCALLELDTPLDAKVSIDDQDYPARRRFVYRGWKPDEYYICDLTVRFSGVREVRRKVILKGGWAVRLRVQPTDVSIPELVLQSGHNDELTSVAFSPDGTQALTGSRDKTAILWDAKTGNQLRAFAGHLRPVSSVAFSPDNKQVLTGSSDGAAILWDSKSGQRLVTIPPRPDPPNLASKFMRETVPCGPVAFSPVAGQLVVGGSLWDAKTGQRLEILEKSKVWSLAAAPPSNQLVIGAQRRSPHVSLWDASSKRLLRTFDPAIFHENSESEFCASAALSPDGKQMFVAYRDTQWLNKDEAEDNIAFLWDADSGKILRRILGGRLGRQFPQKARPNVPNSHNGPITSVAFFPDGKKLLTGSRDWTAIVWDAVTGKKLRTFPGHTQEVSSVAVSPDGQRILTGGCDSTAIIWDVDSGQKLHTLRSNNGRVSSVAISGDGKRLATGSEDSTAALWDMRMGQKVHSLHGHTQSLESLIFNPDGTNLLTASLDATAMMWDAVTGQNVHTLQHWIADPFLLLALNTYFNTTNAKQGEFLEGHGLLLAQTTSKSMHPLIVLPYGILAQVGNFRS